MQVSTAPKGQLFTRSIIAKAIARIDRGTAEPSSALAVAADRWGSYVGDQIKSFVDSGDVGSIAAREFFGLAFEQSLLGRIPGLRRVPFNVKALAASAGAQGYWVAEGSELPLSKPTLAGSSLPRLRVGALIVETLEAIRAEGSVAEAGVQRDILRAVSAAIDEAFIGGGAGTPGIKPASITNGLTPITGTTDLAADVAALLEAFDGDLLSAVFVTDPSTAVRLAAVFESAGIRGGDVLGVPLIVSRSVPRDSSNGQLVLLDPTAIAVAYEPGTIDTSEHGAVAVTVGQGAAAEVLPLWQNNLLGLKSENHGNWSVQLDGAVAVLEVP
ncbi:MAG: phage major capsid protein [Pseudomonas sp.]|uniref:phage major capsid family protein n=1 Tax=Pseudomonas sp. TaxID=306 RepID=UPI003BB5F239